MGRNLQNKIVNRRGSTTMISVERELAARRLRKNQKPTTTVGKCPNAKNGKGNPCDCGLSVSNNLNKDKRKRNSDYERNTRRRKRQKKDESQPCIRKDEWPCNCGIDVQNTPNKSLKSDGETSEKMGRKSKKKGQDRTDRAPSVKVRRPRRSIRKNQVGKKIQTIGK